MPNPKGRPRKKAKSPVAVQHSPKSRMRDALAELNSDKVKVSVRSVSQKHNVRYTALRRRYKGDVAPAAKAGRPRILPADVEEEAASFFRRASSARFSIPVKMALGLVGNLTDKCTSGFKECVPSRTWLRGLLGRNELSERQGDHLAHRLHRTASKHVFVHCLRAETQISLQ
jgi:hypothetical protein